ncbi:NAD(P)-binding protein [Viridothelium virens]|uniref:NAD(P)-binding protein n=1 Tax=Viridothelium virens TaxID=1048519 RepID=A0A6A6HDR8_VIRVR|nr:NAD(P)-binding protein [Viridothelium virens]
MNDDPPEQDISSASHSQRIAIIGAGTIGLSIATFHIPFGNPITIYDTRPNLHEYIQANLPPLLASSSSTTTPHPSSQLPPNLTITTDLASAVQHADIIQESTPEVASLKQSLWARIERLCPPTALLWSSTSGIPASTQSAHLRDPSRLLVVHPYNPPHIMPLLEVVPSPATQPALVRETLRFWREERGRRPVLVRKEVPGFVANRLAFALLREAVHLVAEGVVGVRDVDAVVEASMGPRWAVAGPLRSYAAGGGEKGLKGFFEKIGGTVQECWRDQGRVEMGGEWEKDVFREVQEAYGTFGKEDAEERDSITRGVLEAIRVGRLDAERRREELKVLERVAETEKLD